MANNRRYFGAAIGKGRQQKRSLQLLFENHILHSIYIRSTDGNDLDQQQGPNSSSDAAPDPPAASTSPSTAASHHTHSGRSVSNYKNLKGFPETSASFKSMCLCSGPSASPHVAPVTGMTVAEVEAPVNTATISDAAAGSDRASVTDQNGTNNFPVKDTLGSADEVPAEDIEAMRLIINDKRYGALKTLGERKQAFNEHLSHRKKQEAEENRMKHKKAREDFKKMLEHLGGGSLTKRCGSPSAVSLAAPQWVSFSADLTRSLAPAWRRQPTEAMGPPQFQAALLC
ncbi:hypothetical protein PIB30_075832 [Stylosanthes scabra]|uniref:FF domain-containing protein n=1 Tax=Stylosanthes scabra TaxID=79078 RepID=A0ABU6XP16_9FABA|nr:hypothetical protein [Stylosanthes scabra]